MKISAKKALVLVCCLLMVSVLASCGNRSGNTYDEPEITAEYLSGEYADQLLTDGAEKLTGSVSIDMSDGIYKVTVTEKQVVASDSYDEGYYIAENNMKDEFTLGSDARIVVFDEGEPSVSDADGFISGYNGLTDSIYTIYTMGTSVELIIPLDPEDLL